MNSASIIGQRLPTDFGGMGTVTAAYRGELVGTKSGLLWRHDAGRLVTPPVALLARVAYLKMLRRVLPGDLLGLPNWVCWRFESGNGPKPAKVPVNAHTGQRAQSNNCRTWATFDQAGRAYLARDGLAGLGVMLGESQERRSGLIGVDLDGCIGDDGRAADWAAGILQALPGYVEISPSGRGLHILMRGELPAGRRKSGAVEVYAVGRFFTVTGRVYG